LHEGCLHEGECSWSRAGEWIFDFRLGGGAGGGFSGRRT
jgi:hypothetical protein